MVADAVTVEPVSKVEFPGSREKNREVSSNAAIRVIRDRHNLRIYRRLEAKFPKSPNRELKSLEQGKHPQDQGSIKQCPRALGLALGDWDYANHGQRSSSPRFHFRPSPRPVVDRAAIQVGLSARCGQDQGPGRPILLGSRAPPTLGTARSL
jgi:hypothetical protein